MGKVVDITDLRRLKYRNLCALAHGCFDILHIGHIRHLQEAKRIIDGEYGQLFVTVTADEFVNKGPERPFFTAELRAEALAALSCVDYVAINNGPNAIAPIELLRPKFFVKGKECQINKTAGLLAEVEAAKRCGCEVWYTESDVYSSTDVGRKVLLHT